MFSKTSSCRRNALAQPQKNAAFTLLELLVVVAIIALLIGLLVPMLSKAREVRRRTVCAANLHGIGIGFHTYAGSNGDRIPNGNFIGCWSTFAGDYNDAVWSQFASDYVPKPAIFHCPSATTPIPNAITIVEYYMNPANSPDTARISYDFFSMWYDPAYGPFLRLLNGKPPLAWDRDGNDDRNTSLRAHVGGGNVVFADGHAEFQLAKDWEGRNLPSPAKEFYP